MTRKNQIKILDNKIESNINQYKVNRLNAEISAFSSGDLNRYEFLTRKDSKYKPNALDKSKFEFSPLGKAFSTGSDRTAEGYKEEGVIKLLKDIRDNLAGGVNRPNRPNRPNNRQDNNDDNNDNKDVNDNNDDNKDDYDDYDDSFDTSDNNDDNDNGSNRFDDISNNDKKNDIEKKLDTANNKYNHLLLEYFQSRKELMEIKDKLNEAGDDINKKIKYIDELKKNQEELNYQNAKVVKLESELKKKK